MPTGGPELAGLLERISMRVPGERAEVVAAFARVFTRRLSGEDLTDITPDDLFGVVSSAFDLADARGADPVVVRAFNPTVEHGYKTPGSILQISTDDSPFLLDSVTEALLARHLSIRRVFHPVVGATRDAEGHIAKILHAAEAAHHESVMHFELDRRLSDDDLADLEEAVTRVLGDVRLAVRDFKPMRERIGRMVDVARAAHVRYPLEDVEETIDFLQWLLDDNFVFLGYREYDLIDAGTGRALQVREGSGLGILSDPRGSAHADPTRLSEVDPALAQRLTEGDLLIYSKTNRPSTVHRRARMDDISVRRVDEAGNIAGHARVVGLFTSKAYMEPASATPFLHRKLRRILDSEDLFEGSHDYKAVISIFESFPKDALFAAPWEELRTEVMGLLAHQDQQHVALWVRRDLWGRAVNVLVAVPRDRFNAELRMRLQDLFVQRFHGTGVDYHLSLGEGEMAQIHFTVHVDEGQIPDVPFTELEEEVLRISHTWDDLLREQLEMRFGRQRGRELADSWSRRFPDYYKDSMTVDLATVDIEQFERLEAGDEPFVVGMKNESGDPETLAQMGLSPEHATRVALYKTGGKVQLSAFMPILEALGLRVIEEVPTQLVGGEGVYVHDYGVLGPDGRQLDLDRCGDRAAECIAAVWRGDAESDSLNRLVVTAGLTYRQVAVLRAYRKYAQRVNVSFTEEYQYDAFAQNPLVAAKLVRLFELRFDPSRPRDEAAEEALRNEILADLDQVASLDQDRILRGQLGLIDATVRTNAFREGRRVLSMKLRSADVPDMPRPYPLYEIFAYSPEMEGVHLRGGKVARGGIRWSDRKEDYRTEILGLMKAQVVKNAVIVPTGSKGGFVLKRAVDTADRMAVTEEVRRQYVTLMWGMLDLTDNLVDGTVVHPPGVRVLDEEDPYLVVAADKGTAALSDTANSVAEEFGFWLGDAFASGGSAGYDHKKLGITARGAWESVKRHFRELDIDPERGTFTAIGIGDMSGDVFGNGMLLSDRMKLVAAFDHRHVFIDPAPDPAASFEERKRLFEMPSSSWDDYDRAGISEGGGVWPRSAKSIPLSPQIRAALGIDAERLMPNEVIRAILRAPVDLLWNGGVGTYVKGASESNADAGDRANDGVRVDGRELRCRVVAEGGNLGFTQRGRIEFANGGGRINTDFIDNSGGVDCSDHEVNLKILLGLAIQRGELTREGRNELLQEVVDDVVTHVLYDNYNQALILSQEVEASGSRMEAYEDLMQRLEEEGVLDRDVWALPLPDEMAERRKEERGMTRPELAVILAFAKRSLVNSLLRSTLPDSSYLERDLRSYFPPMIVERFGPLVMEHPLRRELVATIVANDVVNSQGVTFVSRMVAETGAESADVARAFRTARDVTGAVARWAAVESLDGVVDTSVQDEVMLGVDSLVETVSRWYLTHKPGARLTETIEGARPGFERLSAVVTRVGTDAWRLERGKAVRLLMGYGVPEEIARRHAFQAELVHGPDIIAVAQEGARDVEDVARAFFLLGEALHIDWLETRLEALPGGSRWYRWAVQAMEDDLLMVRRQLAQKVLAEAEGRDVQVEDAVDEYLERRSEAYARLSRFMRTLAMEGVQDLAAVTVAVRQIRALVT